MTPRALRQKVEQLRVNVCARHLLQRITMIGLDTAKSAAVDTEHHLIVTHEVTSTGSDRSQLAKVASQAKEVLGADHLDVVADRGYFNSTEILVKLTLR